MKALTLLIAAALWVPVLNAQNAPLERLSPEVFDVTPPASRVVGTPGRMTVQQTPCRTLPTGETRRRIVDVTVQEWAFFGFPIVEPDADEFDSNDTERRFSLLSPADSARAASSIAGYWAVTPEGAGIVAGQNRAWNGPEGIGVRWVAPWSAAFVSWVMCESGLGSSAQFRRAIAHHAYIDQAIRARDGSVPQAAFVAYDPGEAAIEPGDLLCTSRRPAYRNLAERRRQMGEGARTHCDVVTKVDEAGQRIFAIGGNVRRSVSMKLLPAEQLKGKYLRPVNQSTPQRARPTFAHLKLRAKSIEANALDNSPTIKALACTIRSQQRSFLAAVSPDAVDRHC
jgi:hypothetical protein